MAELLTLDEVADKLRVSRRTVERLIAAGRIRPTRVGARTLVTEQELSAYVAAASRRA
jgi:excisionase family DNA binding protein